MAASEEWDWRFSDRAEREFENLQQHEKERIVTKLDEIVTDQWREPADYVEPLTGQPHSKLRVGAFRLGCDIDHGDCILWVYMIEKRLGAYKPGDDLRTRTGQLTASATGVLSSHNR